MKLYSTDGPAAVTDPETGDLITTDEDDALIASPALHAALAPLYVNGKKAWEDEVERDARLIREEVERRRDPATLLDAVAALQAGAASRELTAAELLEAEEARDAIRLKREREAEEDRERERARLEEDARILAERKRIADENAELDRIELERQHAADLAARDASAEAVAAEQADEDAEKLDNPPADGVPEDVPGASPIKLDKLSRPELDTLATEVGIADPAAFANKTELREAIATKLQTVDAITVDDKTAK